jgi:hypothetical protein
MKHLPRCLDPAYRCLYVQWIGNFYDSNYVMIQSANYEESVVVRIKSNLLPMIFWLHIINYNS